jgi:hypothetical protein
LACNRAFVSIRELSWMTPFAVFLIRIYLISNPSNSSPANTNFGGNNMMGIVGEEGNDVSVLPRSDGLHSVLGYAGTWSLVGSYMC